MFIVQVKSKNKQNKNYSETTYHEFKTKSGAIGFQAETLEEAKEDPTHEVEANLFQQFIIRFRV